MVLLIIALVRLVFAKSHPRTVNFPRRSFKNGLYVNIREEKGPGSPYKTERQGQLKSILVYNTSKRESEGTDHPPKKPQVTLVPEFLV